MIAANTHAPTGRNSAPAMPRTTNFSLVKTRETTCSGPHCAGRLYQLMGCREPAPARGDGQDHSQRESRKTPVEERRLRIASCDDALFIITTSPFDSPQPPPPFHSTYSAERRLVVPAKPCSVALTQSEPSRAVRCYRLYGDKPFKFRRTETCLARGRTMGNEGRKKSLCGSNLTLTRARGRGGGYGRGSSRAV